MKQKTMIRFKSFVLLTFLTALCFTTAKAKNLKGKVSGFRCEDSVFKNAYIDVDRTISKPVKCRYIHGGFDDGTKFTFFFPLKKSDFKGRFFQYITPFPDDETKTVAYGESTSPVVFAISHGAYFVNTNEGGAIDFTDPSKRRESSIGAYRANAACAQLSRYIAHKIYDCPRPYGYCYGGSGGAYRTTGGMESTTGVWDGAVPFVQGSPQAIPNTFAVRMYALRILRDKMDDIVDALEPGGSGNPYATLNAEQRQVLQECSGMGFPIRSWYGWRYMDAHGFVTLYQSLVAADNNYFHRDFWWKPGYLGYDNPPSLQRDHIQHKAVVKRIIGQTEAENLGLVEKLNAADRGSADRSWASMGSEIKDKPVAYELDQPVILPTFGGDLILLNGKDKGQRLQISGAKSRYIILAGVNQPKFLMLIHPGDSVQVDNSDWLATETYYRHSMPTSDYYVWNQFRGYKGQPIYPQRPVLFGPHITRAAAGCLPGGKINGKVILCCSLWDREAFAWQGDWYRKRVQEHLKDKTDDNFRLWYTDRATHGGEDDPTEVVSYTPTVMQALLDLSDWVERGIAPSKTSDYTVESGQVMLSDNGSRRGGIQLSANATVGGKQRIEAKPGEKVTVHVVADVPRNTGMVVKADWCFGDNGKTFNVPVDLSKAKVSSDGEHIEFDQTVSYTKSGTYFPTCKIYSQREGVYDPFTSQANLAKVRVVVK